MSNNGEELKNENTIFSYATIPEEKALVEKKNWKDILFMDIPWVTMKGLFLYSTFFTALAFVTMLFVFHGDSKPLPKKSALENFDTPD